MKPLRQLCAIAILMVVLASSGFAGDIECGVASPPPPEPPPSVTIEIVTDVTKPNITPSNEIAAIDPLTELTLNIFQSVLSLF